MIIFCKAGVAKTALGRFLVVASLLIHSNTCNSMNIKVQRTADQLYVATIGNTNIDSGNETAKSTTTTTTTTQIETANEIQQQSKIPGLYNDVPFITPIQGRVQFEQLVLRTNQQVARQPRVEEINATNASNKQQDLQYLNEDYQSYGLQQTISLVQFYMATCPDCQGFSPYFKRLIRDIGPNWQKLIRVFVVNCNDDLNINLCWSQNPTLYVPLVRWYTFPILLNNPKRFNYPIDLLNVAHRQYIEKQRRDLISLRRATIRFMVSTVEQLSKGQATIGANDTQSFANASLNLYNALPSHWKQFIQLGKQTDQSWSNVNEHEKFLYDISDRMSNCANSLGKRNVIIQNVIVFERRQSFVGKTLIADWSNHTCSSDTDLDFKLLVHFTNNLALLNQLTIENTNSSAQELASQEPLMLSFASSVDANLASLHMKLMASNSTSTRGRYKRDSGSSRDLLAQPSVRYYRRQAWQRPGSHRHIRSASNQTVNLLEAENINWAPPELYPGEEALRHRFNVEIAHLLSKSTYSQRNNAISFSAPGVEGGYLGEIKLNKSLNSKAVVEPKDEDMSLVTLTDYYKSLAEIVHKNLLARAELDGYQVAGSACFLRHLSRYFPFQGGADTNVKSISRNYIDLLYQSLVDRLRTRSNKTDFTCFGENLRTSSDFERLNQYRMSSDEVDGIEKNLTRIHQIGIPSSSQLKWSYCNGSSEYLRGHTCSLWLLFHSLTVEEVLQQRQLNLTAEPQEYEFTIDYRNSTKQSINGQPINCVPANPETAYLNASSRDLFVDAPQFVLANVINFVRFYLPCTNCAAHFNCMVQHSRINLRNPSPSDHMLWLWEAHNRVNLRTRFSHSEDPLHPKHLFPNFDACPKCYLDNPGASLSRDKRTPASTLESVRFNRPELIKFLITRYRRSSIVNNKVRIEELFRGQLQTANKTTTTNTTTETSSTPKPDIWSSVRAFLPLS